MKLACLELVVLGMKGLGSVMLWWLLRRMQDVTDRGGDLDARV